MSTKNDFFDIIYDNYFKIVNNKLPTEQLKEMCNRVTDYYYELYSKFRKQHPKSAERYSKFQVKDLNHPQTFDIIINYFKEKTGSDYTNYATLVLGITLEELREFEKNRKAFFNMF